MSLIAPTLYAVSSITVLAGAAIAPAMGEIAANFPGVNPIFIQMIITLPSIMVIPCTYFAHSWCKRFGKKNVLLTGLVLYCVGGCGAAWADSIWTILALRAVLGLGMGTITPVCHSLPADHFSGAEKVSVIGRMSAFVTMGAAVCSVGAGWLAVISWRASFGIYAVSLGVLLMAVLFLPRMAKYHEEKAAETTSKPLPKRVYLLGFTMMLYMAAFYTIPLGLAIHLEGRGIGDSRTAGILLALISVVAFGVGLRFPALLRRFAAKLPALLVLALAAGYLCIAFAWYPVQAWIGCLLVGLGLGGLTPWHFVRANHAVERQLVVKSVAVVIAGTFSGQFLSPFLAWLAGRFPLVGEEWGVFGVVGIAMACIGVALLFGSADEEPVTSASARLAAKASGRL